MQPSPAKCWPLRPSRLPQLDNVQTMCFKVWLYRTIKLIDMYLWAPSSLFFLGASAGTSQEPLRCTLADWLPTNTAGDFHIHGRHV